MKAFLGHMKAKEACPPRKPMPAILWSWLGSLVGIYVIGSCGPLITGESIRSPGYWYVLFPVLCGSLILWAVALIVNNLSRNPHRHYPVYWF